MRCHPSFAAALATLALASPALGLDMRWSSGSRDLRFSAPVRCTLLVQADQVGEALPTEWRLVWVAEASLEEPIAVVQLTPVVGTIADVCALPETLSNADIVSRTRTALLCTVTGGRASTARTVLDIREAIRGRISLVPVEGNTPSVSPGGCPQVTLNGGVALPDPPLLVGAHTSHLSDSLVVVAHGKNLVDAAYLDFVSASEARRIRLHIVAKADNAISAVALVPYRLGPGRIEIASAIGWPASVQVPGDASGPRPSYSADRFVVRFRANQARLSGAATSTPLDGISFASSVTRPALAALGVVTLQPVFPWFKHSDVNSTNSIGESVQLEDLADFYYAHVAPGTDAGSSVRTARTIPAVLEVGADYGGAAALVPDDPLYQAGKQWGLKNTGQTICTIPGGVSSDIKAEFAWDMTTGSPAVSIAILDTGIDTTHQELLGRARGGPAFVDPPVSTSFDDAPAFHGTAVTGLAAATGNNNQALAGVAWSVVPWAVKVLRGIDGFSRASWVGQGISWATANQIPIINMSIGFPAIVCPGAEGAPIPADSANIMNPPLLNALYAGQFAVASMGNCNGPATFWPAAFSKRVYSVGAYLHTGARAGKIRTFGLLDPVPRIPVRAPARPQARGLMRLLQVGGSS